MTNSGTQICFHDGTSMSFHAGTWISRQTGTQIFFQSGTWTLKNKIIFIYYRFRNVYNSVRCFISNLPLSSRVLLLEPEEKNKLFISEFPRNTFLVKWKAYPNWFIMLFPVRHFDILVCWYLNFTPNWLPNLLKFTTKIDVNQKRCDVW